MSYFRCSFFAGLCALSAACAEGSEISLDSSRSTGGGEDGSASTSSMSSSSGGSTSGSTSGSGGSGGADGGAGGGGAGGGCDFMAPNECTSAEELPEVDGDQGSDMSDSQGEASKWFKVYVAEAVSSPFEFPALSFSATLQSPPGATFDLFAYKGDAMKTDCFAAAEKATGVPATFSKEWSDAAGSEDGTWWLLEVRHTGGDGDACDGGPWTLTVTGHTTP